MDKDFKKIFDKLWDEVHNNISKADKIHRVMDGYQNYLDQMVEEKLMTEILERYQDSTFKPLKSQCTATVVLKPYGLASRW